MKTGIFLCTCSRSIDIDFRSLGKSIEADVVEIHDLLCGGDGPAKITESSRRHGLGRALIACPSRKHVFEAPGEPLGLPLLFVNLREHCGRVHERKEATEKARILISAALRHRKPVGRMVINVGKDVLVTGELFAALQIASYLAKTGNVHILDEGGSRTGDIYQEVPAGIKLYAGRLMSIEGRIGDFCIKATGNPINSEKCISCGKCLDACKKSAIRSYPFFAVNDKCDSCGNCIDACPVHAIDFSGDIISIRAGQVLSIGGFGGTGVSRQIHVKKGIHVTPPGKTEEETLSLALPAAMEIMLGIGKIEQEMLLEVSLDGCAAGKSGITGCNLCENVCAHGAIARREDRVEFDEVSCMGCGACSSVCPLSLPKVGDDLYAEMEHLLPGSQLSPRILMFTCNECAPLLDLAGRKKVKYPAVIPLFVPDLAAVSETHILRAFDLGADGVVLLGCGDCIRRGGEAPKLADIILEEFGLGGRISVISNGDGIDGFVKSLTAFSAALVPGKKHEPVALRNTSKRHVLLGLLRGFAEKTGIRPHTVIEDTGYPFADVSISPKCTVCGACTSMCPTGALKRGGGSIRFAYGYCIACGLCGKACPEAALTMHRTLDIARLIDTAPSTLFESDLIACASCKKPYMTQAAFNRIADSLIMDVRSDIPPQQQAELVKVQVEMLKFCGECRSSRAVQRMGLLS